MPSRPANRNVRQPDVFAAGPTIAHAIATPGEDSADAVDAVDAVEDSGSRTLRRGLQLLDAILAGGREGLRVVDLCRAAGLERATVYRLLSTLVECGYVAQKGRFRYVGGPRLAAVAQARGTPAVVSRLQPVLALVSEACGDAAFAVIREGALSHCIARHVGSYPVQVLVIQVGTRQPLGVGAAGLALLSALPDREVENVIAANAATLERYGGMTPERMRILVRATRERGWSVIGNHATRDVLAVGMVVRDAEDEPVAAISVASTMARMPRARQDLIVRAMRKAFATQLPRGL